MKKDQKESFWYHLPNFGEIEFPAFVLAHLNRYRQKRIWHKEAGGQLFWEYMPDGKKRIGSITGPRPSDQRTRTSYKADPNVEQREIDDHYEKCLYFLGDWHTHPERVATPSTEDRKAIKEIYESSTNPGAGFLLVVIGTRSLSESISVSWCDGKVLTLKRGTK